MNNYEIYMLLERRSSQIANKFLNYFDLGIEALAYEYEYPQYEGNIIYSSTEYQELFKILEENKQEPYSFYWSIENNKRIKNIMIFFNTDNSMTLGLTVLDSPIYFFKQIKKLVNGQYGYSTYQTEEPPPETLKEFLNICLLKKNPIFIIQLYKGKYIN